MKVKVNKGNPEIDALTESELARFFEEHKDDLSLWGTKAIPLESRPGPLSAVTPVRFEPEELTEIFLAAEAQGIDLSEFIRQSALERLKAVTKKRT